MESFGLHQTQSLTQALSPQMQQSLALLQAPVQELRTLVQQELTSNPALEELPETSANDPTEVPEEMTSDARQAERDEDWREYFAQSSTHPSSAYSAEDAERRQFFFDSQVVPQQLSDHLSQQLSLASDDPDVISAGDEIIGNIDEDGFLKATLDEVAMAIQLPLDTVQAALRLIQSFDPVGVGARDLRECLLIQVERLGKGRDLEAAIISHHLGELSRKKYQEIARALKVPPERVGQAAHFIATLQPRPGSAFATENRQSIVQAELAIVRQGDDYQVILNDGDLPRVRISDTYKDLLGIEGQNGVIRDYLKEKIRSGKFLIKCLALRQQTLFNIATAIVQHQREFLENGVTALRPLTMNHIAAAVGVHETTVSRAIANKYVQTPQGLFDLKFFFTPGYQTANGEMLSNASVKDAIQELVTRENHAKPLSDQEIVTILDERGIPLARRTVAKYRAELNILPSNLRREARL
jgi:RNA polymerase sigma-54 factor